MINFDTESIPHVRPRYNGETLVRLHSPQTLYRARSYQAPISSNILHAILVPVNLNQSYLRTTQRVQHKSGEYFPVVHTYKINGAKE
jgi:hypothetical protein